MIISAEELVSDNLQLISLPEIVTRINDMVDDPNCTAVEIGELISTDAALSARLLKIVNSSFYNFPSNVDTISMAITIIGTRQLRDLALATSVTQKFRKLPDNLISIDIFWHHSLACATAARVIADKCATGNSERYFITGLLHDIGKMVMYLTQPDLAREVLTLSRESKNNLDQLEQTAFGFTHAELGKILLQKWQLPESLYIPVGYHDHPQEAPTFQFETCAIHLANGIANTVETILSEDDDLPVDPSIWGVLGLSPNDLDELILKTQQQLGAVLQIIYYDEAA